MKTGFIFRPTPVGAAGTGEAEVDVKGNGRGDTTSLSEVRPGFRGVVQANDGELAPLRLREMGFVPGTEVHVLRQGPLGDPVELELRGYRICLRRCDLARLRVVPLPAAVSDPR